MGKHFFQEVLSFYGDNSSLSATSFENFLNLITSRGAPASVESEADLLKNAEVKLIGCYSLLYIYIILNFCLPFSHILKIYFV